MSKTYTLQAENIISAYDSDGSRSSKLAYTVMESGNGCVGYRSSHFRATSFFFNATVMAHLADLGSANITSVTLSVPSVGDGGTVPFYAYGGVKKSTATDTTEISAYINTVRIPAGTPKSIDLTEVGIGSVPAYSLGNFNNSKTAYGYFYVNRSALTATTLTVVTAENDYTLTYSANGGSGAPAKQTGTGLSGYTFTLSATAPTRTGYAFLGWSKSASATAAAYHGGDSITVTANTTLYAVWQANTYTLRFYPNPGTGDTYTVTKTYGVTAYLLGKAETGYTRTGYDYDGWALTQGGERAYTLSQKYTANAAATLYAHWVANTYTVGFNAHGGTACGSVTVTYGGTYGTLPETTREGYTFAGWYTAETGGTQVTGSTAVTITQDQTLHARWTPLSYTVTYTDGVTTTTQTVTTGTAWTVASYGFSKTGHTQTSWNTAQDGSGTAYLAGASVSAWGNLTLYAQFTPNTYTITFDAQGGSGCDSKTVTYGQTYGTLPTPTRARYGFNGWFTASSGGTRVKGTDTVGITADTTLYAQWTLLETTYYYRCNVFVKTPLGCVPAAIGNMASGQYRPGQTYYRFTEEEEDA